MRRKYRISRDELKAMTKEAIWAAQNNGKEICGLLVTNGYFVELVRTVNKTKRGGGFSFYSKEINSIESAAKKLNHKIVGTFHSHPYYIAEPGESDISDAFDDEIMLVIDVINRDAALWRIGKNRKVKLEIELI
jgi:proteasome lid subunit RPN8/RPN11